MSEKIIRIRIRDSLYKKFKIICAINDLSIPKQTEKLLEEYIKSNDKLKVLVEAPYDLIEKIKH